MSASRLEDSATPGRVKRLLQGHVIEVKEVFVFASKIKGTKAAKVRVDIDHKERAKDGKIWPDWIYKAKAEKKSSE